MERRTYAAVRAAEQSARAELASVRLGAPRAPGNSPWLTVRPRYRVVAAADAYRRQVSRNAQPGSPWDILGDIELGGRAAAYPWAPPGAQVRKARRRLGDARLPRRARAVRLAEVRAASERRAAGTIRMADVD